MPAQNSRKKLLFLALGALGVVYGDIGTSPLYAIKEIFFGRGMPQYTESDVFGAISLVFWSITIIISLKYIILVLRADHDGEGGVFALYSLIHRLGKKSYAWIATLLVIAAGLLYGDGMITPAISVISAVEGLTVATSAFQPYIIPITLLILTALFFIQSKGTAKVGAIFGPIMIIWFVAIGMFGAMHIFHTPAILGAINPLYVFSFIRSHSLPTVLFVLGSVILVITGGEALYADLGHFGKAPIRISWFSIVYPSLLLNYFGQGAYLLSGQSIISGNLFFSMVPATVLVPMVILATAATVIASQALISGAFSLTAQAISLGLFPYLTVNHTHEEHEGQVYIPLINWILYGGAVFLVLAFRTSNNLAAAYGLAVSGVMFITTLGLIVIAKEVWKWRMGKVYAVLIPFLLIDGAFLAANSVKIVAGGYIPLYIGLSILILIRTWQWGRQHVVKTYRAIDVIKIKDLIRKKKERENDIPRAVIMMTPRPVTSLDDDVPLTAQIFLDRYKLPPHHIIFLTVAIAKEPHIHRDRYQVTQLYHDHKMGSITSVIVHFGFMEDPHVEKTLRGMAKLHEIPLPDEYDEWYIHVVHERILPGRFTNPMKKFRYALYKFIHRNTDSADQYFGLGHSHPLTVEVIPVTLK